MELHPPFYENDFYHVYNRGNNGEFIFYEKENYLFFLRQYDFYLTNYLETYAYSLLPNHFHFLVRVRDFKGKPPPIKKGLSELSAIEEIISEQFRRLFTSFSKAINKREERYGSLFQKNFKRKEVNNDSYFMQLVYYIHANPQLHGFCSDFRQYPYSSYQSILSDRPTKVMKNEVLTWFGGKNGFEKFHSENISVNLGSLTLE